MTAFAFLHPVTTQALLPKPALELHNVGFTLNVSFFNLRLSYIQILMALVHVTPLCMHLMCV